MISAVKVDEDLPRQVVEAAIAHGWHAASVLDQGWQGCADPVLWSRIHPEQRWLITGDKGFADLRRYPLGSHCGVILLRPHEENRRAYAELADAVFSRVRLDESAGALVVATARGIRIRRPRNG